MPVSDEAALAFRRAIYRASTWFANQGDNDDPLARPQIEAACEAVEHAKYLLIREDEEAALYDLSRRLFGRLAYREKTYHSAAWRLRVILDELERRWPPAR